ncbi:MAG: hypothetical protein J6Z32_07215 [Bacteroidales bacterium]|nr:hypothetical protein [Bacteroidales bacterium]
MKKFFKSLFAVLFAASIISSCSKDTNGSLTIEPKDKDLVDVTIIAGNPTPKSDTKTEMSGTTPYWSVGDAIGVTNGTSTNYKFTTGISSPATTASFTGTTSVSDDLYAYYPYNTLGVSASGAKVEIPVNQNPTASSFDGAADIMFSKKFNVSPASTTVNNLEFARAGAILKVVFVDATGTSKITGQHPNLVSITATENLVGRVYLDVTNQTVGALYGNQSKTVNANFIPSTWFAIDGTNGAYIIVYPQTLAESSSLTFVANTESYAISKTVTIPAGGIKLAPGKITTMKVNINDANVEDDAALNLPFADDYSWQDGTAENGTLINGSSTPALPSSKYSTCERIYTTTTSGEIRIGTSSNPGYLTTLGINLSAASHITVNAKQYGSDNAKIWVSVDGGEPIEATNDGSSLGASYKAYIFNIPAATAKSKVTIATSAKRAYVNNVLIEEGTYVPPVTPKALPYNNTLIDSHTDFTVTNISTGSLTDIWTNTSYGVQASAYGTTSDVESYLVSPSIDLNGVTYATLSFDHTTNFFADVATAQTQATLQIKVGDGAWTNLVIPTYPASMSNTAVHTAVPLDPYCGNVVQFRFKYLATSSNPGRWQIKNFLVKESTHSVSATPNPAVIGGSVDNFVNVTATADYEVTYSTTGSGFTVTRNGNVFTLTATGDGGASESSLGTLIIKESDNPSVNTTVTVKQASATSGEALPFNWDGGKSDGTSNMTISAGSDYASSPKVKFQTANSHYIVVRIASSATTVSFQGKCNGTANGNVVTLQGSVDGSSYSDIQAFTIASGTNTYTSTSSINSYYRYIKLILTTKATSTNTAMGSIHIE